MDDNSQPKTSGNIWNVPNSLSVARLILAILVGFLIEWQFYFAAMIIFIVAASTDFIDGWWARRYGQITKLGRVLDPFVDKIIITAAMIALVGAPGSRMSAWMVTVVVGRELLVTSLRAMIEGQGGDFSARWLGKWKMLFQCAAVVSCLLLLVYGSMHSWLGPTTVILCWIAIVSTVVSGLDYVAKAIQLSRNG